MTIKELLNLLDTLAPLRLAESWDNVGLLLGDPSSEVRSVMTCLTLTPEVAREAIEARADVIVSHHPILFRPVKAIRADRPGTDVVWSLARAGIAVISHHTAWDSAIGGANDTIAQALGLSDVVPLRPSRNPDRVKFVVFVPESNLEAVREAAFEAGAGHIGLYDECSFTATGTGTFRGAEDTNPTIGEVGQRERVEEGRLEIVCRKSLQGRVLDAIRRAHVYEEPAIDVYPLLEVGTVARDGVGRIGTLDHPMSLLELAERAAAGLKSSATQISPSSGGSLTSAIRSVAIACGAGDDLADDAIAADADVLVTGELRFHTVLKARQAGLATILVGHHASERMSMDSMAKSIESSAGSIRVWASRSEAEPLINLQVT